MDTAMIPPELLPKFYDDASKWKISHAGRASLEVFRTVSIFFFIFALISVIGRVAVRLSIRRKLFIDDYVLLFGTAALIAGTAVMFRFAWLIFVLNILKYDQTVIPTAADLAQIANGQAINYSLVALVWTAIYMVKLTFLVSFKVLIQNVSRRINMWYWGTGVITIIFWGLMISLSFIECPYTGDELIKHCTPETPKVLTRFGMGLSLATDILTDIMIIAIPLYILRHVRIALRQKLAIASFLCLSVVMIVLAIVRMCLSRRNGRGDLSMQYLLLYCEACIAITMAATSAYRAVFVEYDRQREQAQQAAHEHNQVRVKGPSYSFRGKLRGLTTSDESKEGVYTSDAPVNRLGRPEDKGGKIDGLMTYIRGFGRSTVPANKANPASMESTVGLSTMDSTLDSAYYSGSRGKTSFTSRDESLKSQSSSV